MGFLVAEDEPRQDPGTKVPAVGAGRLARPFLPYDSDSEEHQFTACSQGKLWILVIYYVCPDVFSLSFGSPPLQEAGGFLAPDPSRDSS